MYRSIFLKNGDEWACESTGCSAFGYGVFYRKAVGDGDLRQFISPAQTMSFSSPQHFSRYIHRHFRESDGSLLPRMTRHDWKD